MKRGTFALEQITRIWLEAEYEKTQKQKFPVKQSGPTSPDSC